MSQPPNFTIFAHHPSVYSRLPDFDDAQRAFETARGEKLLDGPIRDTIIKHGVEEQWALQIIHHHFPMTDSEKLVFFGRTSIPVDTTTITQSYAEAIRPISWVLTEEGAYPYEFSAYQPDQWVEPEPLFFSDIYQVLKDNKLETILGLTYLPCTVSGIEITQGRANITLPFSLFQPGKGPGGRTARWHFSNPEKRAQPDEACKHGIKHW